MAEESNATKAMKLAASTGVTLKEAWAQVKAGTPAAVTSDEDDEALIASIVGAKDEGW